MLAQPHGDAAPNHRQMVAAKHFIRTKKKKPSANAIMPTGAHFPASTISLFMSVMMLRDFQEMNRYMDSVLNLSLNLFLEEIRRLLEDLSQNDIPEPLMSRMYKQLLDLSALIGDALHAQVLPQAELQMAISMVLRAEKDNPDGDASLSVSSIIVRLRDIGLATILDSSIRQAYVVATDHMPFLRGEWRLDFHCGRQIRSIGERFLNVILMSDLLLWRFGLYTLYDCIKGTYMDVHLFPAYESGGCVGYDLVLKHAEDTDWPYELSHNPPAWDPTLSAHHKLIWGPDKVTQSDVPAGFHESLLRILDAWQVFYEDLQQKQILSGGEWCMELIHELFRSELAEDVSKVKTTRNICPKPDNQQWRTNAITLWERANVAAE